MGFKAFLHRLARTKQRFDHTLNITIILSPSSAFATQESIASETHPRSSNITMEGFNSTSTCSINDLEQAYVEMLVMCQPFYELSSSADGLASIPQQGGFYLHPRLEDGLPADQRCDKFENPQDPTSSFHHEPGCPHRGSQGQNKRLSTALPRLLPRRRDQLIQIAGHAR